LESDLESALRAIRRGDDALELLIRAWQTLPDERLSALIERLGTDRDAATEKRLSLVKWRALAERRQPRDLPRLLAMVCGRDSGDALERLRLLHAWPRDPRTSSTLIEWLCAPPFTAFTTEPFWVVVFETLGRVADPRAIPLLARYESPVTHRLGQWMTREARALAERMKNAKPARPNTADNDAIEELARIVGAEDAVGDRLLEAIRCDPHEDGPRLVYADWLNERNDPLGELISLQMAKEMTKDNSQREKALLAHHRKSWLGPLSSALGECEFERGFPARGRLTPGAAAAIGDPHWATIERLDATAVAEKDLTPLLTHPVMRGLRSVVLRMDVAALVAAKIAHLEIEFEIAGTLDRELPASIETAPWKRLVVTVHRPEVVALLRWSAREMEVRSGRWRLSLSAEDGGWKLDAEYESPPHADLLLRALALVRQPLTSIHVQEPGDTRPVRTSLATRFPTAAIR
jgi:uncharacterized protein (TIGR02996 family)